MIERYFCMFSNGKFRLIRINTSRLITGYSFRDFYTSIVKLRRSVILGQKEALKNDNKKNHNTDP